MNSLTGQPRMTELGLSICICTYNRADYLHEMLQGFAEQALSPADEILVINNNSSDHTSAVIAGFTEQLPIREVFEAEQGLSHARNRALEQSKNAALVFFDDDIILHDEVIAAYREAFRLAPDYGFFGGQIGIAWPNQEPLSWWREDSYALLDGLLINYRLTADERNYSKSSRLPYGANFGLNKAVVRPVGQFDTALGVSGASIDRGEESDFFLRTLDLGISGRYLPNAVVQHRFEAQRLTLSYLLRYGFAKGKQSTRRSVSAALLLMITQASRGVLQWVRGRKGYAMQCAIMVGVYAAEGFHRRPDDNYS